MILTVSNCDTGALIQRIERVMPEISISAKGSIEDCRIEGTTEANKLSRKYGWPDANVTTNVDCQWEWRVPTDPA